MTVTYTSHVATVTGFGCFWKLLFRWRGSVYKLLWPNFMLYIGLFASLSFMYRFVLNKHQQLHFEKISVYCAEYSRVIQIEFILGFYVKLVVQRWWTQYLTMPWPDSMALLVSTTVHGQDDRGRLLRRTIMRYLNISINLVFRMMSPQVKKRFPTLEHFVIAGFLTSSEKKIIDTLDAKCKYPIYWVPLIWAGGVITRARKEGRIRDDYSVKTLIDTLNIFRSGLEGLLHYDWINIPLVYTQVVTIAVYIYFGATLMGNQALQLNADSEKNIEDHHFDTFFPIFTLLQFLIYMGWLKVAEALVNPWGEDDDDFELNWLIDRNLQVSYVIVDEMHAEHPELIRDQYWDQVFPTELPYTAETKQYQSGAPPASTDLVEVKGKDAMFVPMDTIVEEYQKMDDMFQQHSDDDNDDVEQGTRKESVPVKIERLSTDLQRQRSESVALSSPDNIASFWKKSRRYSSRLSRSRSSSTYSRHNSISISDTSRFLMIPSRTTELSLLTNQNQDDDIFRMSEDLLGQSVTDRDLPPVSWSWQQNTSRPSTGQTEFVTDLKPVDLSLPDDPYVAQSSTPYHRGSWEAHEQLAEQRLAVDNVSIPSDVTIVVPVCPPMLHTFFSTLHEVAADISYTLITILSPNPVFPIEYNPSDTSIPTLCTGSSIPTTSLVTTQTVPPLSTITSTSIIGPLSSPAVAAKPNSYTESSSSTEIAATDDGGSRSDLQFGISSPFIPSAAIPVPAVSPAHLDPLDPGLDVMETRKAHFELEAISEQTESTQLATKKEETNQELNGEDVNTSSTTSVRPILKKKSDPKAEGGNSSKS